MSTFVVILNETLMGVALPHVMADLRIDASAAQWLTSAFMLTMAVVIPVTGFLLRRFTTRTVFIIAMTLFSAGTLFAAASARFEPLVGARIVQASGTAIMVPLLFTTVLTLVPESSRGRAMGNISIVTSVAPAIGPTISGAILSVLHWRWMFILVLPIAIASLILGIARVQNVTELRQSQLDVLSVILSGFGFGGVVYGLSATGTSAGGIRSSSVWLPLLVGAVALTAFIVRQLQMQPREMQLLDLRAFRSKTFTIAVIVMTIHIIVLFGTIILLPIYTQNVLHLTPIATGLLLLPGGLFFGLLGPIVGRSYDRIGPTVLLITGAVIVSASLWGMVLLDTHSYPWMVLAAHSLLCVGFALLFTPLFTASLSALPVHLYSYGSVIVGTVQQLAGAAGSALFVSILTATVIEQRKSGLMEVDATAAGIHSALLCAAITSLAGIPLAFFIRRAPPPTPVSAGGAQ